MCIRDRAYNDGKRGFNGWNVKLESEFLSFVEKLSREGTRFMVSYVIEHKGIKNDNILNWINNHKFNVDYIDPKLGNSRNEVLITNDTDI